MKRYRRDREGNTYFFTLVTHNRRPILTTPENVERLREAFRRVRRKHPFSLAAIVVLPDHLHAIWELPLVDTDYSSRWAQIKRYFSVGAIGSAVSNDAARLKRRELEVCSAASGSTAFATMRTLSGMRITYTTTR